MITKGATVYKQPTIYNGLTVYKGDGSIYKDGAGVGPEIPNLLCLVLGDKFEDGILQPNYNLGNVIYNTINTSCIDNSVPSSPFPFKLKDPNYPNLNLKKLDTRFRVDFSKEKRISLEYYFYRKSTHVQHPIIIYNNHAGFGFSSEGSYGIFFIYYDENGVRRIKQRNNYTGWFHVLVEIDCENGFVFPYINGVLLYNDLKCEKNGNVSLLHEVLGTSYWNAGPYTLHLSFWKERISGGASSFSVENLYREWGIIE